MSSCVAQPLPRSRGLLTQERSGAQIFLAFSAIGCLYHPLTTAAMGALWIAARAAWAHGYSSDPLGVGAIGRYRNSYGLGGQVWSSILVLMMAAASTSLAVLGVYDAVPSLF